MYYLLRTPYDLTKKTKKEIYDYWSHAFQFGGNVISYMTLALIFISTLFLVNHSLKVRDLSLIALFKYHILNFLT